jgi:(p)ppGpp synthase/HD superfamily hydrolase
MKPRFTPEDALAIAAEAHAGQVDKAGTPYIEHPRRVMAALHDDVHRIVAALHDVVEDAADRGYDLESLAARGVPPDALRAIEALTKRAGEPVEAYWARVAADPVARTVKLADIADNSDPARLACLEEAEQDRLRAKYARARVALGAD